MFKSFAASLLPLAALARGDNDGSSWDNASSMSFTFDSQPGVVVTLQHYNKSDESETEGEPAVLTFHGDTQFTSEEGHNSNIRYGWCVSLPDTVVADGADAAPLNWDCQTVETNVDPLQNPMTDGEYISSYNGEFKATTDGIWTGAAAEFTNAVADTTVSTDPENTWTISTGKSHKRCIENDFPAGSSGFAKVQEPPSNFVTCPAASADAVEGDTAVYGVDMHFFRNFDTASDQDMKLMLDAEPAAEHNIFAFVQTFLKTDFTGKAIWSAVSAVQTISPVSAVFKTNLEAAQKAIEDAAAQQVIDDEAAAAQQVLDDDAQKVIDDAAAAAAAIEADAAKEDGAMQITAHATAVLAAVYALAM